jgi:hypothetical protein
MAPQEQGRLRQQLGVIAAIVVPLPFCGRPVSLPVAFALWTKGGPTLLGQFVTRIESVYVSVAAAVP